LYKQLKINQKSTQRPFRSQSPKRVGSGPLGPPVSPVGFLAPSAEGFSVAADDGAGAPGLVGGVGLLMAMDIALLRASRQWPSLLEGS